MSREPAHRRQPPWLLRSMRPGGNYTPRPDPIRAGWPGPMAGWTRRMREVFDRAEHRALMDGEPPTRAWASAYGAVTAMPEGRVR